MNSALSNKVLETNDRRPARRSATWRCVKGLVLLALLVGGYLMVVGFPAWVRTGAINRLAEQGYQARIDHLRWVPGRGVVAETIRLQGEWADRPLSLRADRVVLGTHPRAWRAGRWFYRLTLENAEAQWGGPVTANHEDDEISVLITALQLQAHWPADRMEITELRGRLWNMPFNGQGVWIPAVTEPAPTPEVAVKTDPVEKLPDPLPDWVHELWTDIRSMTTAQAPHWSFEFYIPVDQPDEWRTELEGEASGLMLRGLHFSHWQTRARLVGRQFELLKWELSEEEQQVTLTGVVDWDEQTASIQMKACLESVYIRNLLPPFVREHKEWARVKLNGPVALDFASGPVPWDRFGREAHGRIHAQQLAAHDVWLEKLDARFELYPDRLEVNEIDALVGTGQGQGPATGDITFNWAEGRYDGSVHARFDAREVLPLAGYSRVAAEIIQDMQFNDVLPEMDVVFSGDYLEPRPRFNFDGLIKGEQFVFGGSWIESFEATFMVTNRVMRMDPFHVVREEGEVTGWYQQDFNRKWIELEVESQVHPLALGRLASREVERMVNHFRFEGPVELTISGRIDYDGHTATDYRVTGRAQQVGWRWLLADEASGEWQAHGNRIALTNIQARLYGGELDGDLVIQGMQRQPDEPLTYEAHGRVRAVALPQILRDLRQVEDPLQSGLLEGRFSISGQVEQPWHRHVAGRGRVRIRDGEIFRIRLLGGLTRLLERIYHPLGSVVQSDVRADFELADGQLRSDEVLMEGNILSLRARGTYDLDEQLDFRVQVQPLRRGWLVDAVRWVTYPVTRLLQFRLEGTLDDPKWRIENIPRELWSLFERNDEAP